MKITINTNKASRIEIDKLFNLLHNGGWDFKVDDNPNNDTDDLYDTVLVHVSRTWERIRMNQEHEEMPVDNIASTDVIGQIATQIFEGKVMQGFVNGSEEVRNNDYWMNNTEEGMSDIFIEALATEIIRVDYLGGTPKPKWEQINDGVEINEEFLPNSDLTYTIEFNGVDLFRASLEQMNFDRKMVGVEAAPKTILYKLDKALKDFTEDEKEQVLSYRGLQLSDGFGVDDVFIEKSYVTLHSIPYKITMDVEGSTTLEDGESAEEFLERCGDIYLHGRGDNGHGDKEDLGGNTNIKYI